MRATTKLLLAALLLPVLSVSGVASAASVWDDTDIVHWRVWQPGKHGLIQIHATDTGMQLAAALEGLAAGEPYRIIGTNGSGGCSSAVTSANRTFLFDVVAGNSVTDTYFVGSANGGIWKTTEFIRIRRVGGADWACATARHYGLAADPHDLSGNTFVFGDGSVRAIVSVERTAHGEARLSVAVGDLNNDSALDLTVKGSPRSCGRSPGTPVFNVALDNVVGSRFATRMLDMTQQQLDSLRSFRIRTLTGNAGQDWFGACRKSILVALLLP